MPRPSRLALLTTYYRPIVGGVEAAAEQLAGYLARTGRPVTVLTKRVSTADPPHETIDGVDVQRTGPAGDRRASGKWIAIPWFLRELWRSRGAWRAICCVDFRGIGVAALIVGLLTGTPVVFETSTDGTISGEAIRKRVSRLGFDHDGPVARAATWPVRALYGRADLFLCVSRTLEAELRACGIPAERIRYLPHPVDRRRFHPLSAEARRQARATRGVPADAVVVAFVGRLSREKGLAELLAAWDDLERPAAHLLIVGPDMPGHPWDEGPRVRQFVAARPARDVTATGGVPPDQVAAWLQVADIAVVPSHHEAFGIAAAEAMASGLPVVASDVGGLKDFVVSGVNGLRVAPRDAGAIRDALRHLIDRPADRAAMGAAALETAAQFDETVVLEQVASAIEAVAASRHASRGADEAQEPTGSDA